MIKRIPMSSMGYEFISSNENSTVNDEFYFRFKQNPRQDYRPLTSEEISHLIQNKNYSQNWNQVFVSDEFEPDLIQNCRFYGLNRIGKLSSETLFFHDIQYPIGLYNSTLSSCDIGDYVSMNRVTYLAHYIIGNESILQNIGELVCTNHAKFGIGTLKEEESEEIRIWLEVANENGNRKILPFTTLNTLDAYLWSTYREDKALQEAFLKLTNKEQDTRRGYYGSIGQKTVIKETRVIKDVNIGDYAYIKGANKLKNLTIKSQANAATQIGEGVELVNGIIGYGCHIFYGVKAVRFVICDHSHLKYGARLLNSVLGENSTISCCEVLNSLIFPGHEQHHNSSFLCASRIQGQSNIASNVTAGSNHNSRANDGELIAKRGFWPGLSTSLKLFSSFASFTLIAKGSYPHELNLPLPFTLLNNNEHENSLTLYPAFWFLNNMYALERNSWKYAKRDKRLKPDIYIEFDYLAPDTINELIEARTLLEEWVMNYYQISREDAQRMLNQEDNPKLIIYNIEQSPRPCHVYKAGIAYQTFQRIIKYYLVREVSQLYQKEPLVLTLLTSSEIQTHEREEWHNLGGLLIPQRKLENLRHYIREKAESWENVHQFYKDLSTSYQENHKQHLLACFKEQIDLDEDWIVEGIETAKWLQEKVLSSRAKDYAKPEDLITFRNLEEQTAVLGDLEKTSFITEYKQKIASEISAMKNLKNIFA